MIIMIDFMIYLLYNCNFVFLYINASKWKMDFSRKAVSKAENGLMMMMMDDDNYNFM